jgi:hypothetical protein
LSSEKQEHRFLLLQCQATPREPLLHHVCLLLFIKGPLKEGFGAFGFLLLGALLSFLGFCFWGLYFGLFGVGRFWKGKELLKGKTVEGKMLKGLIESLH